MTDYRDVNRANWDDRAQAHAASADYDTAAFVRDKTHLSDVVRFDLPLLGDVAGLRGVHLQCHIGTDTLSLARLGATMTGLDFSPKSLAQARSLAERAGPPVDFVESDVSGGVRPGLHGDRRAGLAARHPPLGTDRRGVAAARWPAVHPRGSPGVVGARLRPYG
jgi:hypothetical protein